MTVAIPRSRHEQHRNQSSVRDVGQRPRCRDHDNPCAIVRTQLAQAVKQRDFDLGLLPDQRVHTTPYQEKRLS